ncbi:hypothetical protein L9F63_011114, partial [Diploptera punctata]
DCKADITRLHRQQWMCYFEQCTLMMCSYISSCQNNMFKMGHFLPHPNQLTCYQYQKDGSHQGDRELISGPYLVTCCVKNSLKKLQNCSKKILNNSMSQILKS